MSYHTRGVFKDEDGVGGLALGIAGTALVAGSYKVSGKVTYENYENPDYSGSEEMEVTLVFTDEGKNRLSLSVEGEDSGTAEIDLETGKCTFNSADGAVIKITFSRKNGNLHVKMKFTLSNEYVYEEGTFTGYKS